METIGFEIAESSSCLAVAREMGSGKAPIVKVAADDEVVVVVGVLIVAVPQDDEEIAESSSCLAVAREMGSGNAPLVKLAADEEVIVVGALIVVMPKDDEDPGIEIVEIGGGRSWRTTP